MNARKKSKFRSDWRRAYTGAVSKSLCRDRCARKWLGAISIPQTQHLIHCLLMRYPFALKLMDSIICFGENLTWHHNWIVYTGIRSDGSSLGASSRSWHPAVVPLCVSLRSPLHTWDCPFRAESWTEILKSLIWTAARRSSFAACIVRRNPVATILRKVLATYAGTLCGFSEKNPIRVKVFQMFIYEKIQIWFRPCRKYLLLTCFLSFMIIHLEPLISLVQISLMEIAVLYVNRHHYGLTLHDSTGAR